jgi:hypothetical protein
MHYASFDTEPHTRISSSPRILWLSTPKPERTRFGLPLYPMARRVESLPECIEAIDHMMPNLIIADSELMDMRPTSILSTVRNRCPDVPVFVLGSS